MAFSRCSERIGRKHKKMEEQLRSVIGEVQGRAWKAGRIEK